MRKVPFLLNLNGTQLKFLIDILLKDSCFKEMLKQYFIKTLGIM